MAIHPADIKNTFFRHLVTWLFFFPLLMLIFVPLVLPDQEIHPAEVQMLQRLGVDTDTMTAKAVRTFKTAFVGTGLMPATERFFGAGYSPDGASQNASMPARWIRGVWLMVYKTIWRLYGLFWVFIIPVVVLTVPSAIDGLMVRARKRYNFQTSNPLFFYSSTHILVLCVGLVFFLPFAPFTLSTWVLFAMIVAMSLAAWVAASNFQIGD